MSQQSLENLLVAIGEQRDRQAFIQLFQLTATKLKAYAMRGGASDPDAEEILQECMINVWRKAHTYNPKHAAASTWLFRLVRNKRIDFFRKQRPEQVVEADDLYSDEAQQPDHELQSDLNNNLVRKLIQRLPLEQRQLIYNVYFDGQSHSEIAEHTGLPLGTIKSRLRLAMKKLDLLAKEHYTWLIIILLTNC